MVLAGFGVSILIVPRFHQIAALMWVFLVSTLLLSYGVEWYFQAIEQYKYITIRSMVFKMLSLVAMLVFVRGEGDYLAYGVILALVICGNNVLNLARMLRMVSFSGLGPMHIGRHLKPLASYAVLSIASSVYLAFDSILLGMLSPSNVQVGLYQLASKLKGICFSVINAIIGVLIPRLSYYAKNDLEKYGALLRRGWGFLLNLCLGIALYLLVCAYPLVVLISSEKYVDAVLPVRIIGLVNLFSCMSYFFGLCILSPVGPGVEARTGEPHRRSYQPGMQSAVGWHVWCNWCRDIGMPRRAGDLPDAIAWLLAGAQGAYRRIQCAADVYVAYHGRGGRVRREPAPCRTERGGPGDRWFRRVFRRLARRGPDHGRDNRAMGIRNLARIHEKEIIGKPKSVFGSVFRVCSARALFCLRESNFVRGLSFYWT